MIETGGRGSKNRTSLELKLTGASFPDGEIPLHRLALIADRTQAVVLRLARSLTDRARAGRTPQFIEDATELRLRGIRRGSTVLEIVGPSAQAELELVEVPPDVGTQALEKLLDGLDAISRNTQLPEEFDELSREALVDWLEPLEDAEEMTFGGRLGKTKRFATVAPKGARAFVMSSSSPRSVSVAEGERRTVEGVLYALNLRTGQYRLEDDAGHSIFVQIDLPSEEVGPLIDKRVRASGIVKQDAQGRPYLTAHELRPSEGIAGLDREAFFASRELSTLISTVEPLDSFESLALDDVSDDEADAFLAALQRDG